MFAVITVPKQQLTIVLPYLGSISGKVKSNLKSLTKRYLPSSDIVVVFKSSCRLSSMFNFNFEDKLPAYLFSGVLYKYACDRCKSTYIGKTKRYTRARFAEHADRSPLSGKLVKGHNYTTLRDLMLVFEIIG